jgi:hypothetical protein
MPGFSGAPRTHDGIHPADSGRVALTFDEVARKVERFTVGVSRVLVEHAGGVSVGILTAVEKLPGGGVSSVSIAGETLYTRNGIYSIE